MNAPNAQFLPSAKWAPDLKAKNLTVLIAPSRKVWAVLYEILKSADAAKKKLDVKLQRVKAT